MSTEKKAPFFAQFNSEQILNSNPMLDWMENNLIYAPGTVSLIGKRVKTPPGTSEIYAESRKYRIQTTVSFVCNQITKRSLDHALPIC